MGAVRSDAHWADTSAEQASSSELEIAITAFLLRLPCPPETTPLEEVVQFRRDNEAQLETARAALRGILEGAASGDGSFATLGETADVVLKEVDARLTQAVGASNRRLAMRIRDAIRTRDTRRARAEGLRATGWAAGTALPAAIDSLINNPESLVEVVSSVTSVGSASAAMSAAIIKGSGQRLRMWHQLRQLEAGGLRYLYDVQTTFR